MASSVQQDLSEFLLSGQQDLLTTVGTTTGTVHSATNPNEIEQHHEVFNLPVTTSSHPTTTDATIVGDQQTDFQELALHNLDNLDSLLVNNR